jgi:hypothetical protein
MIITIFMLMKNDLNLVISALEAEKRTLQKMIKQSAAEHDNLIVYYHSETLLELNHHLGVLYSFRDPLHDQQENLKRQERFLKKKPKGMTNRRWEFFAERRSRELDKQKAELEEKRKEGVSFNDTQEIDDLIFATVEGKIDGFKMIVPLYDDAEVLFEREKDILVILIKPYEPHDADFVLNNRIPKPIAGLGFKYDMEKRAFVYQYNLANFKDAGYIKILLSRLLFDVFRVYDVKQSITLKYSGK